jgi:hypothetical protein
VPVTTSAGLWPAVSELPAIDHHAHLLVRPDVPVGLAEVLTESDDPVQIAAVRDHPAYRRALRDLGGVLAGGRGADGALTEDLLAVARRDDFGAHVARLLAPCHLEEMFVDDGFRPAGVIALAEQAALAGCPVRRIVRIETEAEAAAADGPPLAECRARLQQAVAAAVGDGAIALKTIAAYRGGLDLPMPSPAAAGRAYDAWRRAGSRRLQDAPLVSLFLGDALEAAGEGVPLQVHTGIGDRDQMLTGADPALLQPHLDRGVLAGTPVVLLHCYPFVRNAGYLAAIYPNVHLDLSLAVTLVPHRGPELVAEALELAPPTKLLFATDASRLPEMFTLGSRWWRESLARALDALVDGGFTDEAGALRWARLILADNARRLYRLGGAG